MLALLAERINRASLAARSNASRQVATRSQARFGCGHPVSKGVHMSMLPRWIQPAVQAGIITREQAQRLLDSLYQPLCETAQELPADLADISLKLFCFRQQHRVRH